MHDAHACIIPDWSSSSTAATHAVHTAQLKGEVQPKMITLYLVLVVFGALSRMVNVRGTYDKPFWIYKRLNNCAAPAPASDDVLVVASLACPSHTNTSFSTTKRHHRPARGGAIIQSLI